VNTKKIKISIYEFDKKTFCSIIHKKIRKDFTIMKTKNILSHLLLILLISAQTAFCAAEAASAPHTHEHSSRFHALDFTLGDRGLDGSFLAIPLPPCMQAKTALTFLPHEYQQVLTRFMQDNLSPEEEKGIKQRQDELRQQFGDQVPTPKRALACVGGGSKGLLEIISLTYLETIMNETKNQTEYNSDNNRAEGTYIYISDLFDCGGGTSTGSIIAAGLFYNKDGVRYKAYEVAQLYVRCLGVIFGERHSQYAVGCAQYKPDSLKNLLAIFFQTSTMSDAFSRKRVNIFAVDSKNHTLLEFSQDTCNPLSKAQLVDAILSSSAAPSYFPPHNFTLMDIQYTATDGGTFQNDPSNILVKHSKASELYTFGAGSGLEDSIKKTLESAGSWNAKIGALSVFYSGKDVSENPTKDECLRDLTDADNPLSFFIKINPQLVEGMDLDSTSDGFVHQSITAAIRETETNVFARMVQQLGFKMPGTEHENQKTVLCPYGCLGLTTELRMHALRDIYTLDFSVCTPDGTDGLTKRGQLFADYINNGIAQYGYEFLTMVSFELTPDNMALIQELSENTQTAFKFYHAAQLPLQDKSLEITFEDWCLLLNKDAHFPEVKVNTKDAGAEDAGEEEVDDFVIVESPTSADKQVRNTELTQKICQHFLQLCRALGIHQHNDRKLNLFSQLYFQALTSNLTLDEKIQIRTMLHTDSATALDMMNESVASHTATNSGFIARLTGCQQTRLAGLANAFTQYVKLVKAPSTALPQVASMPSPKGSNTSLASPTAAQAVPDNKPTAVLPTGFGAMLQNATPEQIAEMTKQLQEKEK